MRSRIIRVIVTAAVAAAGLTAGLGAWPGSASAWDFQSLPDGYAQTDVFLPVTDATQGQCVDVTVAYTDSAGRHSQDLGSNCAAGFQQALDAFVDGSICTVNPTAGLQHGMCQPTTTTTTAAATTTATTTTTDTTTAATDTTAAPTATTDSAPTTQPAPTSTSTSTVTVTVDDPALAARVSTLESEYATLADRVGALEDANAAAWQTFHDDIEAGMTVADAALDARSAGLNALYEIPAT